MRKIGLIVLVLLSLLVITGCNSEAKGVSEEVMRADISEFNRVKFSDVMCDLIPQEEYVIEEIKIDKRQTNIESKQDIIYCIVTVANSYIREELYYKLEYAYYDVGGWQLEKSELEKWTPEPIRGIDANMAAEIRRQNDQGVMLVDVKSQQTDLENNREYVEYIHHHSCYTETVKVTYAFNLNWGWSEIESESEAVINWNQVTNSRTYKYSDKFSSGSSFEDVIVLHLSDYNSQTGEVNVVYYETTLEDGEVYWYNDNFLANRVVGIIDTDKNTLTFTGEWRINKLSYSETKTATRVLTYSYEENGWITDNSVFVGMGGEVVKLVR